MRLFSMQMLVGEIDGSRFCSSVFMKKSGEFLAQFFGHFDLLHLLAEKRKMRSKFAAKGLYFAHVERSLFEFAFGIANARLIYLETKRVLYHAAAVTCRSRKKPICFSLRNDVVS